MEYFNNWTDIITDLMSRITQGVVEALPSIIGALSLLLIGWLIAKGIYYVVKKMLQAVHFDSVSTQLIKKTGLDDEMLSVKPSVLIAKFAYWIILLLVFISVSDMLGMRVVSEFIADLIAYLPSFLSALLIFLIGMYIANFVRNFLKTAFDSFGMSAGKFLSEIVFYIILIIVATTSLEQAGIDTTILTANVSIIFGGMLLAFAIAFGFSSRDILSNILSSFYVRSNFEEGQHIIIDNVEGKIKCIENVQTVIETENGDIVMPTKRLASETVRRLSSSD